MQQQQQEFLLKQQTESVSKAKEDLAHLAPGGSPGKQSSKGSPIRKTVENANVLADQRIQK
jgi:hypothetical protein